MVEDNPYGLLRYEGEPSEPLYLLDGGDYVLYIGTLSKILSPGIRLGWAVRAAAGDGEDGARQAGHRPLHLDPDPVLRPRVLRRGPLARLRRRASREIYRERRDAMLEALERFFPEEASWTRPEGGLFVLGDPALLHRHHRPARQGAARERRLRPRRRRLRRRARRVELDAAQLLRLRRRTRSARGSAGSARWSASRSSSTRSITGEHRLPPGSRTAAPEASRRSARARGPASPRARSRPSMKVAVLKGGRSLERQVSLRSGARVEDALASLGHEVVALDVGADLVATPEGGAARCRLHRPARPRRRGRHRPGAARDPRASPTRAPGCAPACAAIDKVARQARPARRPASRRPTGPRSTRSPSASWAPPTRWRRSRRTSASRWWSSRRAGGSSLGVRFAAARRARSRRRSSRRSPTTTGCCSSATSTGPRAGGLAR